MYDLSCEHYVLDFLVLRPTDNNHDNCDRAFQTEVSSIITYVEASVNIQDYSEVTIFATRYCNLNSLCEYTCIQVRVLWYFSDI